jgi:DNA repair protein RadC
MIFSAVILLLHVQFCSELNFTVMKNKILATESFSSGNRHYFLDFKVAENNANYIRIVRSDWQEDETYKRTQVIVWERDFEFLISAFSALFRSAAYHRERPQSIKELYAEKQVNKVNGIKGWESELRPREKMLEKGSSAMSNPELLAMLIGSGSPDESAVALAARILAAVGNDLGRLASSNHAFLHSFAGMGLAKSSAIMAAMELGKRTFHTSSIRYNSIRYSLASLPVSG